MRRLLLFAALLLLAGCAVLDPGPPPVQLQLDPPLAPAPQGARLHVQVGVAPVQSPTALNTARIAVVTDRQIRYLPDAQWSSSAPRLMQTLLMRSLAVSRRLDGVGGDAAVTILDYQLHTFLESFEIVAEGAQQSTPQARVTFGLQLVTRNGRVVEYTSVRASVPAQSMRVHDALDAFENACGKVLDESTAWTLDVIERAEQDRRQ